MTLIDVLLNMNNLKFNMTKFITSRNIKVTITIKNLNEDRINEDKINKDKINKDKINEDRISDDYINENQKLVENQEEILKNSNIEENIKIPLNENHAKTLHDNSKILIYIYIKEKIGNNIVVFLLK
ncbi:hypothetical protein H8356DRAFT_1401559 [Neocallimastix lanati (nom. inval.)]|nr:hypothetical protein H8356DRAFT_1401559 [Neocallimastix sp. JGI-2020a]